jgi:hypothetical protein
MVDSCCRLHVGGLDQWLAPGLAGVEWSMISQVTAVKLSCEAPGCDEALYERDANAVHELARINGWRSFGWVAEVPGRETPKHTLCPVHKDMAAQ